ncbi:hypothetical protein AMTRI_Chr08g164610 [Amborella trichopoda]|uniref:DUF4005 domain-containing protein n=1 Tax=Amborella trichopoda TaxID=13333 RepID=W1PD51_AMBTC|nr:protein IQ-DOMAIN 1 [Amborella trichopoda]ERN04980.1 hypothetical protein AMTR_s00080p00182120 [Amborella trichopoda]|eukprot:XP_006843305.1 protein IQ-DOMAIN 1 [Amborella trichopoda]
MGKKGSWLVSVKNAFSPESKEKREQSSGKKSKKKWRFGKSKRTDGCCSSEEPPQNPPHPPPHPSEELKLSEAEQEQNKHAYSVAIATAVAAEAAVAAAQAAAEVVRLTTASRYSGKSREEVAAIKIQTAFRGYLARRALRALRGLVRLKTLVDGSSVKRQATTTLRCMQTLARVQSHIRARRIQMSEENHALQRQLLQKREKELENLRALMGEDWDDSLQSKEQIEANLLGKHEAAIRRERALAYAFSHQLRKNPSRSPNPLFSDPSNPHWGWSWLERWMAARPWESRERETPPQSKLTSRSMAPGEITKAYAQRESNLEKQILSSPVSQKPGGSRQKQSPSTPKSRAPSVSGSGRPRTLSPRSGWGPQDDDLRSMVSVQSERNRRHSLAGSYVRDDESLASSPAVPSYMAPTQSARAKTRMHEVTPERLSAKKRLSFPAVVDKNVMTVASTASRRHSGPPRVDGLLEDLDVNNTEHSMSNGGGR